MTLALSVIIPVSVMIYSNSRVTEVSKRIDDLSKRLDERFDELKEHIDNAFEHMKLLLQLHEAEHHKK